MKAADILNDAKITLERTAVKTMTHCDWCNRTRADGYLYQYHLQITHGRWTLTGLFCQESCARKANNLEAA